MKKPFKAFLLCILLLSLILCSVSCTKKTETDIRFYKGDSIVITESKSAVIIDASSSDSNEIIKYLTQKNIELIEAVVISNSDKDIYQGTAEVCSVFDAANIYTSNLQVSGDEYDALMLCCDDLALEPYIVEGSVSFGAGNLSVRIYASAENNDSLITRVVCGKASMLFCSDAKDSRIKEFLEYDDNRYDLIKMPSGGESFDSLNDLCESAKPKYAVIGADSKQSDLLKKHKCKVLTVNESLSFTCNGKKITEG